MAANAHHVFRPPSCRCVAQLPEFERHALRVGLQEIDIGIDASGEGAGDTLRLAAVGLPFALHVAPVQEQAGRLVLRDVRRPQHFGQLPESAAAPQVYLEQAVARGIEALHENGVVLAARIDMRHAPLIDQDLGRPGKAGHAVRLQPERLPGLCRRNRKSQGGQQGRRQGNECPFQFHHVSFLSFSD
jgi:hypothetical protein